MSIWEELGKLIQKPQSVMTGATLGLMRDFGNDPTWAENIAPNSRNAIAGALSGLSDTIRPSEALKPALHNALLNKIANTAYDVSYDPLNFVALAPESSKVAQLAETAMGHGKVEGDLGEKLATAALRGARRTYQGTIAADNQPNLMQGAMLAPLMGVGERAIGAIAARVAKGAPEIGDALTDIPSRIQNGVSPEMAVEVVHGPTVAPRIRGNANPIPDFIGNFTGPTAVRGEIAPQDLAQLAAGRQPIAALNPAEAMAMPPGPRPMGPAGTVSDEAYVNNVADFLDKLYGRNRMKAGDVPLGDNLSRVFNLLVSKR